MSEMYVGLDLSSNDLRFTGDNISAFSSEIHMVRSFMH